MIWYKFHVGDYITHTLHLADAEDLAYRRLIDLYMMSEKPIPNDLGAVARKVRLDLDVVEPVLQEFFELTDDGWVNHRCEKEIAQYTKFVQHNKKISKKGVKIRQAKAAQRRASKGSDPEETLRPPSGDPAGNPAATLTETEIEIEKQKDKNPSSTASTPFENFWKTWPASKRKVGREACEKKWRLKGLDEVADEILAHVRAMKQTEQWREGFEPSPITYLNQSRWLDGNPEGDTSTPGVFAGRRVL